jgi:quercetin dioxygenase-like cupin family protein
MHYVGRVDWTFPAGPMPESDRTRGLSRTVVIGPAQGAVHTELAVGSLVPGGFLARHVHSFEEAFYVLEGEIAMEIAGVAHHLVKGDYCAFPVGTRHGFATIGEAPVRFLSVNSPQRFPADAARNDTFFDPPPFDPEALVARAVRPPFGDPTLRLVGHYDGTPPQAEALQLADAARGRRPAGMDSALTVYSGISVRMLVDRGFGADLLTVFTVDYEENGSAQQHDHPFEEAYVFLDGEVEAELDGIHYTIRAGDVVFAGVGSEHGFYNTSPGRVRWIETQAPQPPGRHMYRWTAHWQGYEERTRG